MRISVVVASKGRPEEIAYIVDLMANQTRPPDRLILSVTGPEDLPDIGFASQGAEVITGPPGLPAQRNAALDVCLADSDVVAFFDDDYIPESSAVEFISRAFAERPELDGMDGLLLADGIKGPGISHAEALAQVSAFESAPSRAERRLTASARSLYGCQMAFRSSAIGTIRFDEALPLYGWQEDVDFSARVRIAGGSLFHSSIFAGIHRGAKKGRSAGFPLGYSQIANPVYLARKGSIDWPVARRLMLRNVSANHMRALYPEPWVDRAGRVRGNWIALGHWLTGQIDPRFVTRMNNRAGRRRAGRIDVNDNPGGR